MIRAVVEVLTVNARDWNTIPAFSPALTELQGKLGQLETLSVEQQSLTAGVRAGKEQSLLQMTDKAEIIVSALQALAAVTHDAILSRQLSISRTDLLKANTNKAIQLFKTIRDAAQSHAEALEEYGITAAQVQELSGLCDNLPFVLGSTRSAIVNRRERTETAAELLSEILTFLQDRMDKLAGIIRITHPETWKRYQAARVIVDLKGKSHLPKKGGGGTLPPPAGNGILQPPPDHNLPFDEH